MSKDEPEKQQVSDEEWALFVRDAESGADAPKEPSARARMVTERLRARDAEAARQGGHRWGRKPKAPAQPPGWRTGPAWQEMNGTKARRKRVTSTVAVLALLGLAVVAIRPELVTDHLPDGGESDVAAAPLAPETARPTAAPSADPYPDAPTLKEPFRGSPALRWADGAAGIVVPEAKAVGGMSRKQVAHALKSVKDFLVAANIDPATVRGERPEAALEILDPLQRGGRGWLEKALREPDEEQDPLVAFSRFDPRDVRLVGDVVKTRGRMTFGKGDRDGEVRVRTDYTFVYPLVRAKPGSTEVARTVVRRQLTFALYDPARTASTPGKLFALRWSYYAGNHDCRTSSGYYEPEFTAELMTSPDPSGPVRDPYDRRGDLADLEDECGTVTRT
ncbi:hypothetical protein [Streptomyces peucetius]|uniref:Uncharacterized protein n=1 Tax=Streptomyces peucetius TaxID=1950 RepID=A0ABY6IA59_STRPE|nr:hypothetical protein [Streptomyces peucetius]UYQ63899.1 hypothetical protein OGH68_22170 [Streptomyces peucetius]